MVSYIGYISEYKSIDSLDAGTIVLDRDSRLLGSAIVTGSRIENNARGYTFNPNGSGIERLETAQAMLAFLPGVTVSEDDKVKLLDKNPVIYVNGLRLTSQDELAAIVPDRVEKVEVDWLSIGEGATQKGGAIRITTKKESYGGFSGYLRGTADVMPKYGYTGGAPAFVMDASTGRWTFNYYTRYTHRKLIEDATERYSYDSGTATASEDELRTWQNRLNNRLNVSYELSDRSTIAVSEYIGNSHKDNRQSSLWTSADGGGEKTLLHGPESNFTQQTVGKYILELDDNGSSFEVTADYLHRNYHFRQYEDVAAVRTSESSTKEHTNMYRIAPKLTKDYDNGGELQLGADYQYIHYKDGADGTRDVLDGHTPSAYISYSGEAAMLMYSAGLTLQHNSMEVSTNGTETSRYDGTWLCPQASLMWMLNPDRMTMLALAYQRTVH